MIKDFLNEKDLEHIKTHKYNTTGYSWLDNKMNPFWVKCASFIPYSISPNIVTLIGLFCLSLGIWVTILYDFTLTQPLPKWVHVIFALSMFGGQTFDAIDGKHARATGKTSPLGQLMDHGCDALANSFIIIMIAQSLNLGASVPLMVMQIVAHFGFFIAQWEESHTGIILTHMNNIGVTETQFVSMVLCLSPVFFGNEIWHLKIFGLHYNELMTYISGINLTYMGIIRILLTVKGRNLLSTIYPFCSLFTLIFAEILCYKLHLFHSHTIHIVLLNGIYFGFMISKLLISSMAKRPFDNFIYDNLFYLILISIAIYSQSIWCEVILLLISAIWIIYRYLTFILSVTSQLLRYLNINF